MPRMVCISTCYCMYVSVLYSEQISTSSYGWFVLEAVLIKDGISKRQIISRLKENFVLIRRGLLSCSIVSCIRCVTTGLDRSTQNKVSVLC